MVDFEYEINYVEKKYLFYVYSRSPMKINLQILANC